jgi:hypothetical protein
MKSTKYGLHKITHGKSRTYLYNAWINAKQRCNNPKNKDYANYGGRGIEVRLTYEELEKEVGERPSEFHTLDREDNDGHYEKGNLRWAVRGDQNLNQRPRKLKFSKSFI